MNKFNLIIETELTGVINKSKYKEAVDNACKDFRKIEQKSIYPYIKNEIPAIADAFYKKLSTLSKDPVVGSNTSEPPLNSAISTLAYAFREYYPELNNDYNISVLFNKMLYWAKYDLKNFCNKLAELSVRDLIESDEVDYGFCILNEIIQNAKSYVPFDQLISRFTKVYNNISKDMPNIISSGLINFHKESSNSKISWRNDYYNYKPVDAIKEEIRKIGKLELKKIKSENKSARQNIQKDKNPIELAKNTSEYILLKHYGFIYNGTIRTESNGSFRLRNDEHKYTAVISGTGNVTIKHDQSHIASNIGKILPSGSGYVLTVEDYSLGMEKIITYFEKVNGGPAGIEKMLLKKEY